jgi:hypothetical protein
MQEDKETERIEAFSDGVFGIAMTLLVLEIRVPSHEVVATQGLVYSLAALWPSYLAFSDHPFLYWNGLLLFLVTFLPFPTAVLADYLLHPEAKAAANLYTGTVLAISLAFDGLWRHASKSGRLLAVDAINARKIEVKQITKQYRFGPPLYLAAFGVVVCVGRGEHRALLVGGIVFRYPGLADKKVGFNAAV